MFLCLEKVVGLKGAEKPTWDPKAAITNLQAARGAGCHLQPPLVTVGALGTPSAPSPKSHPGSVPSAGHSVISWLQSWRLRFQHHLLFLELFIAIMLVIHTSGAAARCIQMSANTLPGPNPNFICLCKIFSSGLRPYLCSC